MRLLRSAVPVFLLTTVFVVVSLIPLIASCGASQRETTIKTTYLATKAAADAFVVWDGAHQKMLVAEAGSAETGKTALDAYRVKRGEVLLAFDAVFQLTAAALVISDDPKTLPNLLLAASKLKQALADIDALTAATVKTGITVKPAPGPGRTDLVPASRLAPGGAQ